MRATIPGLVFLMTCVLAAGAPAQTNGQTPGASSKVRDSVAKIFASYRAPDFRRPWTKMPPQEVSGTGFVIEGDRIMTNAHVVEQSRRIYVQPPGSADKFRAEVIGISQNVDLALIEIIDEDERSEFHASHAALPLADGLPEIGATVRAIGYPMGGEQVSITEGVVSRIEYAEYNMETRGLRIQVDAALNRGNSGGPVIMDGEVVGVVFSGIEFAENIGYVIPAEEVRLFLKDIRDGSYDGQPRLMHANFQTCENPALRDYLGLGPDQTGLVFTRPDEHTDHPLTEWDLLDAIGPHDIDNAGLVTLDDGLRLRWEYFIREVVQGGTIPVTVVRAGETMDMSLPVTNEMNHVVPFIGDGYPEYFIAGPMVFTPVRREHFRNIPLGFGVVNGSPVALRLQDEVEFEGEEFVVLANDLLPHPITKGYTAPMHPTLDTVNGVEVRSLAHLVEILRDNEDDMLVFAFHDRTQETLVFDADDLEYSTEEILEDNSIRERGSDRFMEILDD